MSKPTKSNGSGKSVNGEKSSSGKLSSKKSTSGKSSSGKSSPDKSSRPTSTSSKSSKSSQKSQKSSGSSSVSANSIKQKLKSFKSMQKSIKMPSSTVQSKSPNSKSAKEQPEKSAKSVRQIDNPQAEQKVADVKVVWDGKSTLESKISSSFRSYGNQETVKIKVALSAKALNFNEQGSVFTIQKVNNDDSALNLLAQTMRDETEGVKKEETELFVKGDSGRDDSQQPPDS